MTLQKAAVLSMLAALAVTAHPVASAREGRQQQPPVFRSAVTLVPIDVRVVDKSGRPVTDLKREEFTVVEDGVRQELRHLSLQTFTPAEPPAPASGLQLKEEATSFEPQARRIFLVVLGRGKLLEPSKAVDALLRFVRERMLPQDQVAVFAYNRATTFTSDHEQIARVIERFRTEHEQIDYEIGLQMSGLAAIYGSKLIPKSLQGRIDRIFEGSGLLASQRVEPGAAADKRIEGDARRQVDAQIQKQIEVTKAESAALAGVPNLTTWSALDEIQTDMFADLSLEDFVSTTAQTLQDLGNIYAGINYLKYFEGEKHLIFLTEKGLTTPRSEEDEALARAANDARVALDPIQTGGMYVGQPGNAAGTMPDGRWNQTFVFKTLHTIADLTGGVSSIGESGAKAMDRINDLTRATYLVGYYPTNSKWDGAYRKVEVRVSRPGTTVYYRHGYYGRKDLLAFNRREFITTDRIKAAAGFRREITDIRLKVDAGMSRARSGQGYELTVSVNIDPSKLALTFVEGVHAGQIAIAVFCFDDKGNVLGNNMQTADLRLRDADFKTVVAKGMPYRVTFPTNAGVRRVRAVVYDFKADLLGSADTFVS